MPSTLIREYAAPDLDRLAAALAGVANLAAHLAERKNLLFRETARSGGAEELHAGRDDYHRIYDDYIAVAERFQALAEAADSPLAADFGRVAGAVREQRDALFGRWGSFDDLCELLIEQIQPSAAQLRALAERSPPPQSWYDETDDPFQP